MAIPQYLETARIKTLVFDLIHVYPFVGEASMPSRLVKVCHTLVALSQVLIIVMEYIHYCKSEITELFFLNLGLRDMTRIKFTKLTKI